MDLTIGDLNSINNEIRDNIQNLNTHKKFIDKLNSTITNTESQLNKIITNEEGYFIYLITKPDFVKLKEENFLINLDRYKLIDYNDSYHSHLLLDKRVFKLGIKRFDETLKIYFDYVDLEYGFEFKDDFNEDSYSDYEINYFIKNARDVNNESFLSQASISEKTIICKYGISALTKSVVKSEMSIYSSDTPGA